MPRQLHDGFDVPNYPALCIPKNTAITGAQNLNIYPDTAQPHVVVPMHVTSYTPPGASPALNVVSSLPYVNQKSNYAYGGNALSQGKQDLWKLSCEGYIDTPSSDEIIGGYKFSTPDFGVGKNLLYADYIQLAKEDNTGLSRSKPYWFRDPIGRVYTDPRILNFAATYVEGTPGRTNFQMTLIVT
jgi:hypothetical protein